MGEFTLEVRVKEVSVSSLLEQYWQPDTVHEACRSCPRYGQVWFCPPETPDTEGFFDDYTGGFLIGVKVIYDESVRMGVHSTEEAKTVRMRTYEKVKEQLFFILLEMEKKVPGGQCLRTGSCTFCKECARLEDKPCRHPSLGRYNVTAMGFDCVNMIKDVLGTELKWNFDGLPEYDVAVAALLYK